jgi:beta-N-acetylhexosaminidase
MSPAITTELLRRRMGFDGLVVTDALDMAGVTSLYSPGEVAVRSILAGADLLLVPPVLDAAMETVRVAIATGRIPAARIDEAVTRVLRAKAKLGLHKSKLVDLDALPRVFARPEFECASTDIADRGVTLLRDDQQTLPLDAAKPLRALLVAISGDPDPHPGDALESELQTRDSTVGAHGYGLRDARRASSLLTLAGDWQVTDRKGSVDARRAGGDCRTTLAGGKPVIVASFGNPTCRAVPCRQTWMTGQHHRWSSGRGPGAV